MNQKQIEYFKTGISGVRVLYYDHIFRQQIDLEGHNLGVK